MYLPFESTAAIFVVGVFKLALDWMLERKKATTDEKTRAENVGTLLASGFIAGESLMAVLLAFLVLGRRFRSRAHRRERSAHRRTDARPPARARSLRRRRPSGRRRHRRSGLQRRPPGACRFPALALAHGSGKENAYTIPSSVPT